MPEFSTGISELWEVFGGSEAYGGVGADLAGGTVQSVDGVAGVEIGDGWMIALDLGEVVVPGHGREVIVFGIAVVGGIGGRTRLVIPVHQVGASGFQVVDDIVGIRNAVEPSAVGVDIPTGGAGIDVRGHAVEKVAVKRRGHEVVLPKNTGGVVNVVEEVGVGLDGVGSGGGSDVGNGRGVVAIGIAAGGALAVEDKNLCAGALLREVERRGASGHSGADDDDFVVSVVGEDRLAARKGVAGRGSDGD